MGVSGPRPLPAAVTLATTRAFQAVGLELAALYTDFPHVLCMGVHEPARGQNVENEPQIVRCHSGLPAGHLR